MFLEIDEIVSEKLMNGVSLSAMDKVTLARDVRRPKIQDYIDNLSTDFFEQKGDMLGKEDGSIYGGIALFHGKPVTVLGHRKGNDLKENLACNFGMPGPEGYRKALRLMEQAERFGRPIITFIDTPGAYPGLEAEQYGQSQAIANNLARMSSLTVPIISIVTGEGSSGGALAIGVANRVYMLENAVYSILSPEGFASILWKDAQKASEAAKVMKMTAKDLYDLGMIERIISEDQPATADNIELIGQIIDKHMREFFKSCAERTQDEIVTQRYDRFRRI